MKIAIVPGSFDPMTLGHKEIIEKATKLFDKVVVAIMCNAEKEGRFTYDQRLEIARMTLEGMSPDILVKEGYLADFASEINACAYVKGIRNSADLEYENRMERFNTSRNPSCITVYLPSDEKYENVSSTLAFEKLKKGENCEGIMDRRAYEYARKLLK